MPWISRPKVDVPLMCDVPWVGMPNVGGCLKYKNVMWMKYSIGVEAKHRVDMFKMLTLSMLGYITINIFSSNNYVLT